MSKVQTYIQFYSGDVELNISVKDDLTKHLENESLYHFGFFQITNGDLDDKPIFWDNLDFFISAGKKEFKRECKKDLKNKGYDWKEIYKQVKTLLDRAQKLNLL
jgi:hypothetical protein